MPTSATTKSQGRERLRPKSRVRDFLPNMRAIGSLEIEVKLGVFFVGRGRREHTDRGASVDEEGEVIGGIVGV